jgi:hypothetical protein
MKSKFEKNIGKAKGCSFKQIRLRANAIPG